MYSRHVDYENSQILMNHKQKRQAQLQRNMFIFCKSQHSTTVPYYTKFVYQTKRLKKGDITQQHIAKCQNVQNDHNSCYLKTSKSEIQYLP